MEQYNYEDLFVDKIYGNLLECIQSDYENDLTISITTNSICNYKCSYCVSGSEHNNNFILNYRFIDVFLKNIDIINILSNKKFIYFSILGGEPTLYEYLQKLIDIIIENLTKNNIYNFKIQILTNGSKDVNYFSNFIKYNKYIKYIISYHPEFVDDKKLISNIKFFSDNNIKYDIKILNSDKFIEKTTNFINNYSNYNINVIHLFGNKSENKLDENKYNSEYYTLIFEKKTINININSLLLYTSNNINIFKNMLCDIYNSFWIINNIYIYSLCDLNNKYMYILPNLMKKFIDKYEKCKNGIICTYDSCNYDCKLMCRKHINK